MGSRNGLLCGIRRLKGVAILGLLAATPALACTTGVNEAGRADLQELVVRWAFGAAETDLDPPAAYCLAMSPETPVEEGEDPDPAFLDRFSDLPVPVRPMSACRFEGDTRHNVVDNASGEYGLHFHVGPVVMNGSHRANIEVGYLQGSLWGRGWSCSLEEVVGLWEVHGCERVYDI